MSARLGLRPSWLALASSYFLLLPLLFFSRRFSFLCSLSAAARFRRFLSLRHIWADYSWTPRRRLPGPWPAAWTRGGVELNCELNVSHGFLLLSLATKSTTGPVTHVSKGCASVWFSPGSRDQSKSHPRGERLSGWSAVSSKIWGWEKDT